MKKKIITVSREFGSGGRTIGKTVAQRLNIPYYDKELVKQVALESGFDPKFIEEQGEFAPSRNRFAYAFLGHGVPGSMGGMSTSDFLWTIQYRVIRDLADKGPCVIVGRCADYILREHPNCLNVFVHADKAARIKRIVGLNYCEEKKAPDFVTKKDKQRANYYNFYSNNRWDDLLNYDLTIDTSRFSVDMAVDLIIDAAKKLDV